MTADGDDRELETRPVRVDDPNLSPEANQALTRELQDVVGAAEVQVPVGTPHREHDLRGAQDGVSSVLGRNRLLIVITFTAAVVVGAILALATDRWWSVLIPVGVHALGTMAVGFLVVQMTSQPESPDPAVTAQLQDEGVNEPERVFNELVEEFSGADQSHGATEIVTTGDNERTQSASDAPAQAAVEQSTAMTPSHDASESAGEDDSVVFIFQFVIVGGLAVLSLLGALFLDGQSWLLPVVMLPLCALWVGYQQLAKRREDHQDTGAMGDDAHSKRRMALVTIGVLALVELLTIVVVILGDS